MIRRYNNKNRRIIIIRRLRINEIFTLYTDIVSFGTNLACKIAASCARKIHFYFSIKLRNLTSKMSV